MATALEKIIDWAGTLPRWQSDIIRRLLTTTSLGGADRKDVVGMLKAQHGLVDTKSPPPQPIPIKPGDVSGAQIANGAVILNTISDIRNVNALMDGSGITFGLQGLTVVYGENGTGKSGYARLLKRACKARDEKEVIHPNIYSIAPTGPASAVFHLQTNGVNEQVSWQDGCAASKKLSAICVFDGRCARVIVDEDNEAHYLPFGAQVFEQLVAEIRDIRAVLQSERPVPKKPEWPDIPADTEAGKFIERLNAATDLQILGQWTEDDDKTLLETGRRLSQAETEDPIKIGLRLRNLAGRLRQLAAKLGDWETGVSTSVESSFATILKSLAAANQALQAAPKVALMNEPIAGIGSEAWQILYRAARDYSVGLAYSAKVFPYVGQDSRCVLCMQPLSEEAKDRLNRFRDFMEQTAKKAVDDLTKQLTEARQKLPTHDPQGIQGFKDAVDELTSRQPIAALAIPTFVESVGARAKALLSLAPTANIEPICALGVSPASDILTVALAIEGEAVAAEKTADATVLSTLRSAKREMDARKALLSRRAALDEHVQELKLAACYDRCIAETEFRHVTSAGKRIITEALTPELQKALGQELQNLGVSHSHLPLNLRPVAVQGETSHRMEIAAQRPIKKTNLTDILSEGEQRVVALAGFLAELDAAGHSSPIVFDDPVSSLDHKFRRKIAHRLIAEAAKRQVIVFTHDLSFLMELQSNVGRFGINSFGEKFGGVPFTVHTVTRKGHITGQISDGLPWAAATVGTRLNQIRQSLAQAKGLYQKDQAQYNRCAAEIYCLLRETWEAFVEETLFYGVISRYEPAIMTRTLKEVTIETKDAVAVDVGMDKASIWMTGHDKAKPLDIDRPDPKEIEADIRALQDLQSSFKQRRKEAKETFTAALTPPGTAKGISDAPTGSPSRPSV